MKITKEKDYYLFESDNGEYHLSHEQYDKLGNEEAIKLAKLEIKKKKSSYYSKETINLKDARNLGFCEYGIKDFCEKLNLDIEKEYEIEFLKNNLTKEVIFKYPDECLKLFGNSLFDNFGGVRNFLTQNKNKDAFNLIIKSKVVEYAKLHLLACNVAMTVLQNFEIIYPEDNRPRLAIEAKIKWLKREISDDELIAARSAAWSASCVVWSAESAAGDTKSVASYAPSYAAESAAASAARSAWFAAWSAARSAAWSASCVVWEDYCDMLIKELEK